MAGWQEANVENIRRRRLAIIDMDPDYLLYFKDCLLATLFRILTSVLPHRNSVKVNNIKLQKEVISIPLQIR